jgi:hypothetical protein
VARSAIAQRRERSERPGLGGFPVAGCRARGGRPVRPCTCARAPSSLRRVLERSGCGPADVRQAAATGGTLGVGSGEKPAARRPACARALHHGNFRKRVWLPAITQAGLTGVHLHDLRHAGNVLVADAGANLRELMERMGHSTTRAALIYLHGGDERQRKLAASVSERARAVLDAGRPDGRSGTDLARTGDANGQRAGELDDTSR